MCSGRKVKLVTQKVKETMGKSTRTVDTEVEVGVLRSHPLAVPAPLSRLSISRLFFAHQQLQVTALKEMQKDYTSLCLLVRAVTKNASQLANSQAALAAAFAHVAER